MTESQDFFVIHQLARESLQCGDSLQLRISSDSMTFAIPRYTPIMIRWVSPEALKPGAVIALFDTRGLWVVHRFLGFTADGKMRSKGDLSPQEDTPSPVGYLLGAVVAVHHPLFPYRPGTLLGQFVEGSYRIGTLFFQARTFLIRKSSAFLVRHSDNLLLRFLWELLIVYTGVVLRIFAASISDVQAVYVRKNYSADPYRIGASDIDITIIAVRGGGDRADSIKRIATSFRFWKTICPLLQHAELLFEDDLLCYARSGLFNAVNMSSWELAAGSEVRPLCPPVMPTHEALAIEAEELLKRIADFLHQTHFGTGNRSTAPYHLWKLGADSLRIFLLSAEASISAEERRSLFRSRGSVYEIAHRYIPESCDTLKGDPLIACSGMLSLVRAALGEKVQRSEASYEFLEPEISHLRAKIALVPIRNADLAQAVASLRGSWEAGQW